MKIHWIEKPFAYDGTQLQSLFAYLGYGLLGDSIIAWQGPCEVSFEHMVDGEDLRDQSAIRGSDMLHFIVETFGRDLFAGVGLQRLLASLGADLLRESVSEDLRGSVRRDGDDIFVGQRKFSISIATVSPTSCLIHFAVNVSNEGTPVPTAALGEFKIPARDFAHKLMERFAAEYKSICDVTMKVKWVK